MSAVADIERAVVALSPRELREFRQWFLRLDAEQWDAQIERDVEAGKLDNLADEALDDLRKGRTRPL